MRRRGGMCIKCYGVGGGIFWPNLSWYLCDAVVFGNRAGICREMQVPGALDYMASSRAWVIETGIEKELRHSQQAPWNITSTMLLAELTSGAASHFIDFDHFFATLQTIAHAGSNLVFSFFCNRSFCSSSGKCKHISGLFMPAPAHLMSVLAQGVIRAWLWNKWLVFHAKLPQESLVI